MKDMSHQPVIEIAIASDSNYLVPTTVLLKSLFENNSHAALSVNLLYLLSRTAEKDLRFWETYTVDHGHQFRKIPVSDEQLAAYPELRHSKSTYLRLLLPDLLPPSISKILYLDADIIVSGDLLDLYQTAISGYYAAAVKDTINIYAPNNPMIQLHLNSLGIHPPLSYFGAGVMLMNIVKMREDHIVAGYFSFALAHPELIRWSDQDIVNAVLKGRVYDLPPVYNFNYQVEPDIVRQLWTREEIYAARHHPVIIHYIGSVKPWHYCSFHPKTKLWRRYLKLTPFKDFRPQDKSPGKLWQKIWWLIGRKIDRNIPLSVKKKWGTLLPSPVKKAFKKTIGK